MTDYRQKESGSYYTPPQITSYLSERAIGSYVLARLREREPGLLYARLDDLLANLNAERSQRLVAEILPRLRILDPCCGDGAFLVAALNTLLQIYRAILNQSTCFADEELARWQIELGDNAADKEHTLKGRILADNLYGVDSSAAAVALARMRLLAAGGLTQSSTTANNIRVGNALVGLLHLTDGASDGPATPDALLLAEFERLGVKRAREAGSKPARLTLADVTALQPFHWATEFPMIMADGGFDVVLTNPPWEIFKPQAKEFFAQHSELISKKRMDIHAFVAEQGRLLGDREIAAAWAKYLARFPILSAYYRTAPQYAHQSALIEGRRTSSDPNLYKLFVEQCYNLLRQGGAGGMVIPSGIYTDLGATALRHLLFENTEVNGLFCFENRRKVFAGVDNRFKFVALTFCKGSATEAFPTAFMRHDVSELAAFPAPADVRLPVSLIKRLAPYSWSVMELKSQRDVQIVEKMLRFPLLGDDAAQWRLRLGSELHMTSDSDLFHSQPMPCGLPLYEGKMVWQFDSSYAPPRYWVDERAGRKALLGRQQDAGQPLAYQSYRLAIRAIASSTNQRSLIATIVPPNVFCANSLLVSPLEGGDLLFYHAALLNSFVLDWFIRMKVTTNINMFYIYQLPAPRYMGHEPCFAEAVERAARLICTRPEFAALAAAVGIDNQAAVFDPTARAQMRAELDALVAHIYALSSDEFAHILNTFKLPQTVRAATLAEYERLNSAAIENG